VCDHRTFSSGDFVSAGSVVFGTLPVLKVPTDPQWNIAAKTFVWPSSPFGNRTLTVTPANAIHPPQRSGEGAHPQ